MNPLKLRLLPILLLSLVSLEQAYGAEANMTLHQIGSNLNQSLLKSEGQKNSVTCPLGIAQTLASLELVAEEQIQEEIVEFTQNKQLIANMSDLNKLITKNLKSTKKDKKFIITNGLYTFLSDRIVINDDTKSAFEELGPKVENVNFSESQNIADKINKLVRKDTKGKITEIIKANEINSDMTCIFLHTLYLQSEWLMKNVKKDTMSYNDITNSKHKVTSFMFKNDYVPLKQERGITLISLPMAGDCHLIIRHNSQKKTDIKHISQQEITDLMKAGKTMVNFEAPFVSMKKTLDLKELLKNNLEKTLTSPFQTTLTKSMLRVTKYLQMLTFDMDHKGAKASSATVMGMSRGLPPEATDISIDSPFTVAWVKQMGKEYYLLFQAQIVDTNVMILPSANNTNSSSSNTSSGSSASEGEENQSSQKEKQQNSSAFRVSTEPSGSAKDHIDSNLSKPKSTIKKSVAKETEESSAPQATAGDDCTCLLF